MDPHVVIADTHHMTISGRQCVLRRHKPSLMDVAGTAALLAERVAHLDGTHERARVSTLAPAADGLGRYQRIDPGRTSTSADGERPAISPRRAIPLRGADLRLGTLFSEAERAWLDILAVRLRAEGL